MKLPLLLAAIVTVAQAQPLPLSSDQIQRLERGEAIQVLEPLATGWPRSIVYQLIDATPEQAAAVLSDYDRQKDYIPRMKASRIVARRGGDTDVEYVIDIPVYADERSVSRQRVVATGDEYRVIWNTVVDSTKSGSVTTGGATFRPMRNSRTSRAMTLMIHDQSVVPSSVFARIPFVRNKAIEASRDAAIAIQKQIEREVRSEPELLRSQLAQLRAIVVRP